MAEPRWDELLIDELAAEPGKRTRRSVGINFTPELMRLVRDAAEARDMSMAAFVRRAAMAVAAYDLNRDWAEVASTEPGIRYYDRSKTEIDDASRGGRGHGPWRIRNMYEREADHDDAGRVRGVHPRVDAGVEGGGVEGDRGSDLG